MRTLLSIVFLLGLSSTALSQHLVQRQVLSSGGGSTQLGRYTLLHTIGQSAGVGLRSGASFTLRQGFQQPPAGLHTSTVTSTLAASVYPNPTTGRFQVQLEVESDASVTLRAIDGRIVFQQSYGVASLFYIDPHSLAPGTYLLTISASGQVYTGRIQCIQS